MSEKDQKIISFPEFFSPYSVILCTLTAQFWLPHRENFEKKPKNFPLSVQKGIFLFSNSFTNFFHKRKPSFVHVEYSFDKPSVIVLTAGWKKLA